MKKILPLITALSAVSSIGVVSAKQTAPDTAKKKEANPIVTPATGLVSAKTDTSRALGKARPWAHELSDIKADPKTVYGKLPNGMRYVIQKNTKPPGRISMRLHIAAGSLCESEEQRGVAHFLEHMVFNGTKTFPDASKLVPEMQRLGITFGADANAYTSFDETVYELDLPDTKKSTVDLAYHVMGDFADGALLTSKEIDEERGVISSEKTSRDTIQSRMLKKQFKALLPNALVPERFPIGLDKVIAEAPRKTFVDFYTHQYIPEKMTFIVVGDIDVAATEQRIHDVFGKMKNPKVAGKSPDVGDLSGKRGFQTAVFSDKELSSTEVSLITIKPTKKEIDTRANRAKRIPLSIANAILNRRFSRLAKKEGSVITEGSSNVSTMFRQAKMGSVSVTAAKGNWQAAVSVLEQELRRAIEYGFSDQEVKEVIANWLNQHQQQVESAATRKTPDIASELAQRVHSDSVYSTPEEDLEIFKANIAGLTAEDCHAALKKFWDTEDVHLILTSPKEPKDAKKTLAALYQRSKLVKLKPIKQKQVSKFAYTDFGKPGKIVSDHFIKDLGIRQIQFANGIKVNFKKTDFDKNSIQLLAHFGSGKIHMPKDKPGLDMLAGAVVNAGGYGKHSADDLRSLLAGKNVGISFGIDDESFVLSGATTPDDLELELQLLCASLTDTGYRPEAERQFKTMVPMIYAQLKHTAQGAQAQMSAWLHGGDYRFIFPEQKQVLALSTEDVKAWVDPQLKSSALELGIVGDFDPERLLPLLAKTVGALPQRNAPEKITEADRIINVPATPAVKDFHFESVVPTATAIVAWKAEDNTKHDVKLSRRASILAEILSDRMRVKLREDLGEAYSPGAYSNLSETYKNVGFVMAISPVKVKDLDNVGKVVVQLGEELAKNGATEDELKRSLTPRIGMLAKSKRSNSYWLGAVVARSQTEPFRLDWARGRDADYRNIKLEEINALAKKYLGNERSMILKISPTPAEK